MSRRFLKMKGTRENTGSPAIDGIEFEEECSAACTEMAQDCVGFNFKQGPPIMCEICSMPHDAPDSNMLVDTAWDHYAIVPWIETVMNPAQ